MSNTRRLAAPRTRTQAQTPAQRQIAAMLASLDGAEIPGGCDHCSAYQTTHTSYDGPDLHRLTTHHDDGCPAWFLAQPGAAAALAAAFDRLDAEPGQTFELRLTGQTFELREISP